MAIGVRTTAMGFCSRGERWDSTLNGQVEIYSQVVGGDQWTENYKVETSKGRGDFG